MRRLAAVALPGRPNAAPAAGARRLLAAGLIALAGVHGADAREAGSRDVADFGGIYVATKPLRAERLSLPERIYQLPGVDGIYVRLVWEAIEPRPGSYDWTTLDREVARALAAGKKLSLGVRSGFFAPPWLSQQGVPHGAFFVGPHGGTRGRCETVHIPVPWSPLYQEAYARMIHALAQHLRARRGAYEAVRIVKITGINQRTDELRLPAARERPGSCQRDAVTTWQALGYRPSKVIDAWQKLAAAVATAFPDKVLAVNILQANDFPPIGEDGQLIVPGAPGFLDVKQAILAAGLRQFSGRFAVQWNGLSALKVAPAVLRAGEQGAIVGWQTNQYRGLDGSGCEADNVAAAKPCTASSYQAILENGIRNGARYIEVWPSNAEQFSAVIEALRASLPLR